MNFYGTSLTPGMAVLDLVLSNDAGDDSYMIQGLTPMEKVAHGMHMIEMWQVQNLFIQNKVLIDNVYLCDRERALPTETFSGYLMRFAIASLTRGTMGSYKIL